MLKELQELEFWLDEKYSSAISYMQKIVAYSLEDVVTITQLKLDFKRWYEKNIKCIVQYKKRINTIKTKEIRFLENPSNSFTRYVDQLDLKTNKENLIFCIQNKILCSTNAEVEYDGYMEILTSIKNVTQDIKTTYQVANNLQKTIQLIKSPLNENFNYYGTIIENLADSTTLLVNTLKSIENFSTVEENNTFSEELLKILDKTSNSYDQLTDRLNQMGLEMNLLNATNSALNVDVSQALDGIKELKTNTKTNENDLDVINEDFQNIKQTLSELSKKIDNQSNQINIKYADDFKSFLTVVENQLSGIFQQINVSQKQNILSIISEINKNFNILNENINNNTQLELLNKNIVNKEDFVQFLTDLNNQLRLINETPINYKSLITERVLPTLDKSIDKLSEVLLKLNLLSDSTLLNTQKYNNLQASLDELKKSMEYTQSRSLGGNNMEYTPSRKRRKLS